MMESSDSTASFSSVASLSAARDSYFIIGKKNLTLALYKAYSSCRPAHTLHAPATRHPQEPIRSQLEYRQQVGQRHPHCQHHGHWGGWSQGCKAGVAARSCMAPTGRSWPLVGALSGQGSAVRLRRMQCRPPQATERSCSQCGSGVPNPQDST